MASNSTIILTPAGVYYFNITQKYRTDDIINLDDPIIKIFSEILHVPEPKRYQILYCLALNNLLLTPTSDDLISPFQNLDLGQCLTEAKHEYSSALEWVQKNRQVLLNMDELIITDGNNFKIPLYGLTFTGKRSGLFYLIEIFIQGIKIPSNISPFEKSFHLLPNKFIGGIDRIDNQNNLRTKIRAAIETNCNRVFDEDPIKFQEDTKNIQVKFILNEAIIENTFNLIDQVYFSGLLRFRLQAAGKRILFRVSHQMTRTAGSMTHKFREKEYVITISEKLSEVLGNKHSSGILVSSPIDSFITTIQHEITHLIVHLEMDRLGITWIELTNKSKTLPISPDAFKSHGIIFQDIGERFFGLTERTHRFFESESESEGEINPAAASVADRSQLLNGTRIYFNTKTGPIYAKITKLNPKKAQVLPEDGSRGYTVPYNMIYLA